MAHRYFGTYETFETASKKEGGALMGADNLVGDAYLVQFDVDGQGRPQAWLENRFGRRVGYLAAAPSRELKVLEAGGLRLRALLSYVAYRNEADAPSYFGECAVIAYEPSCEEAFSRFSDQLGARLADGVRPRLDFGEEGAERVVASDGEWQPKQVMGSIPRKDGVVVLKARRSIGDKMVEAGRARNKGCYVASVAFLVIVVALVVWGAACLVGLL